MTVTALLHSMDFDMLRFFNRLQAISDVSWLSAAFLSTSFPQTFGCWSVEPIARWWLATVPAILRDLIFQGFNSCFEHLVDCLLFFYNKDHLFHPASQKRLYG